MNITDFSNIPVIQNLVCAVPQAGLRCDPNAFEKSGSAQSGSASGSAAQSAAEVPVLQQIDLYDRKGFQSDYSVRDAAASLFKQEYGTINLFDKESIQRHVQWEQERYKREGTLSIEPTERELDAYLIKLRQEGLDGKVQWGRMAREFQSFKTASPEELSDGIDYLASRYVATLDKLERNYSGEELETQKAKLEEVYQTGVSVLTEGYAKLLQENLGVSGENAQEVKRSLNAALEQRVKDYWGKMDEVNRAVAGSGEDAVWLKNCDAYLAVQLRGTGAGKESAGAAYSVEDLVAAGKIAKLYQGEITTIQSRDEAKLALNLGMADMKAEKLISSGKVGEKMAELLRGSRESGHKAVLDAADQYLADREANRSKHVFAGTYAPMDRRMFSRIYSAVMESYRQSGDAAAAIRAGASAGKTLTEAASRKNGVVSRWNMKSYWKNFYTAPKRRDSGIDVFHMQVSQLLRQAGLPEQSVNSAYQNYVNDWQSFLTSIGAGSAARVDVTV